jgi:exopolysaccharide production protein ExoQ
MGEMMSFLPIATAAGALLMAGFAFYSNRSWADFTPSEKRVALYIVLVVGWPQMWTFFIGPILWTKAEDAGQLYPTLWYLPAFIFAVIYFGHGVFVESSRFDIAAILQYSTLAISMVFIVLGSVTKADVAKLAIPMGLLLVTLVKPTAIRGSVVAGWGCRASLFIITASVLASILVNPDEVLEPCRLDKCGLAGQTLTSPFAGNGNILGLAAAMIVPFAVARINIFGALSTLAAVMLTAELAGSRTAEIGVVVAAVLVVAIWLLPKQRRPILLIGLSTTLAFSVVPAIYPFGDTEFTFRGALWNEARNVIAEHPVLGSGPTAWFTMRLTSIYDLNYSPHNAWLDITLSIGLSGLLVLVIAVALKINMSEDGERDALLLYFATLFAISALESVYVPYILAILPSASVLPFIGGPGNSTPDVRQKVESSDLIHHDSE